MENVVAIILAVLSLVLFYKMLSLTVRIFLYIFVIGIMFSIVAGFFGEKSYINLSFITRFNNFDEISATTCKASTKDCISDLISKGNTVLVVIEKEYCTICKINRLLSLYNKKFINFISTNKVEIVFDRVRNIDAKYPDILYNISSSNLPFNVIFSDVSPFGRPLNRILSYNYLKQQIEEEQEMLSLMREVKYNKKDIDHEDDQINDIVADMKKHEINNITSKTSPIEKI